SVKGEAKYVGMFYPFAERGGVNLKAYASAKPFGGKIGPRLFSVQGTNTVVPRTGAGPARSTPYVFGVDMMGATNFQAGELVPFEPPAGPGTFWAKNNTSPIGGTPAAGQLQFVIPNLLYDFEQGNFGQLAVHGSVIGSGMTFVKRRGSGGAPGDGPLSNPDENRGLLNATQYKLFRGNLIPPSGGILTSDNINQSILNVRRPTRYEAMNYLIPTIKRSGNGNDNLDSNPVVKLINGRYHLFAPLIHPQSLYPNAAKIDEAAKEFLSANDASIQAYLDSLQVVAQRIRDDGASRGAYQDAANGIHDGNTADYNNNCSAMADKFDFFFRGAAFGPCGGTITPLKQLIQEYFSPGGTGTGLQLVPAYPFELWYESEYSVDVAAAPGTYDTRAFALNSMLHGAYTPGPRTGAPDDSSTTEFTLPFSNAAVGIQKRNFYSTKLISTNKVVSGGDTTISFSQNPLYKERDNLGGQDLFGTTPDMSDPSNDFKNKLQYSGFLNEFGSASELDF
ncbi:MAG: hypothetical protein KC493_01835, partial [Bacteriovoracaceae bacterium]|nr:hypothetical protein [Bacteriovoracaceae bacterium]